METNNEVVVATRNAGKVAEIARIFDGEGLGLKVRSIAEFDIPDIEESGDSFEANAILKARTVAKLTGLFALADDSGITVDALGGAPGIYSARWAGQHGDDQANIAKLLEELRDIEANDRGAAFVSVVALANPDGGVITARGELRGQVARAAKGSNGFGYDPIFIPDGESRSVGELAPAEKDAISHRARALNVLAPKIGTFISER